MRFKYSWRKLKKLKCLQQPSHSYTLGIKLCITPVIYSGRCRFRFLLFRYFYRNSCNAFALSREIERSIIQSNSKPAESSRLIIEFWGNSELKKTRRNFRSEDGNETKLAKCSIECTIKVNDDKKAQVSRYCCWLFFKL